MEFRSVLPFCLHWINVFLCVIERHVITFHIFAPSDLFFFFTSQQQSARYFSPHERNNASPTAGNLTVLNAAQCYPPPSENILHRPSCLTCPTIGDHCDHPTASTIPPHPSHFHPFHHNMHGPTPQQLLAANKSLMTSQHATYDSCQK